jgi:alkanesulfonate monooxygenase SsuD/methylene tetrahydromethanopterin reductase-like flavin-dependent oxidoreductase (luciferase family)
MEGRPETAPLLALAERAAGLGVASVWVGDSLTARPRHDPLTLLAAVSGRVPGLTIGTAVLLPMLRNPVVLAHQVATLDQIADGKLILGVGFAADRPNIRAEFAAAGVPFEHRIGRMLEGLRLCKALWTGQPVDWDGSWQTSQAVIGPTPARPGGPLLWIGGNLAASLDRAGKYFDGWFPIAPGPADFAAGLAHVRDVATQHGRDPANLTGAMYLTVSLDDDAAKADDRLNHFLERYYGQPAQATRRRQACYAGPADCLAQWLDSYTQAGASHLVLRFAGDHERHLQSVARLSVA